MNILILINLIFALNASEKVRYNRDVEKIVGHAQN